jgi:small subunit ribosomal protein S20
MANQTENKIRVKRPTALKRDIQHNKRRLINKAFKNSVRTALRRFEDVLASKNNEDIKTELNNVYSLMDKGVKRGVFKINKASRTKSRFTARAYAHMPA